MKIQDIIQDAMYDNRKVIYKYIYAGYMAFALWVFGPMIINGIRGYFGW